MEVTGKGCSEGKDMIDHIRKFSVSVRCESRRRLSPAWTASVRELRRSRPRNVSTVSMTGAIEKIGMEHKLPAITTVRRPRTWSSHTVLRILSASTEPKRNCGPLIEAPPPKGAATVRRGVRTSRHGSTPR